MSLRVPRFGLGVVEGFYGRQWTHADRLETLTRIADLEYRYYIYAPKGDACLRRDWAAQWNPSTARAMRTFARTCESLKLTWAAGLSPLGLIESPGRQQLQRLRDKVRYLDDFGAQMLVLLFDDMPRNNDDMAARQAEIVHEALAVSAAEHLLVCPSYYSSDPVLDDVFGPRPEAYFEDFGALLPAEAVVFWTGDKVCSDHFDPAALDEVASQFGRQLALWDNYPVNDGARMSRFLHLEAFSGRPAQLRDHASAHFVNPMNQCRASDIPLATLAAVYRDGDAYDPRAAWSEAAARYLSREQSDWLRSVLPLVHEQGLDGLSDEDRQRLRLQCHQYADTSPVAREIGEWLDGGYQFDPACLTD